MPAPNIKVFGLWKCNEEDVYNLPNEGRKHEFRLEDVEEDF